MRCFRYFYIHFHRTAWDLPALKTNPNDIAHPNLQLRLLIMWHEICCLSHAGVLSTGLQGMLQNDIMLDFFWMMFMKTVTCVKLSMLICFGDHDPWQGSWFECELSRAPEFKKCLCWVCRGRLSRKVGVVVVKDEPWIPFYFMLMHCQGKKLAPRT